MVPQKKNWEQEKMAWFSRIMDGMLFTFENKVPLMQNGASGVAFYISIDEQLQ